MAATGVGHGRHQRLDRRRRRCIKCTAPRRRSARRDLAATAAPRAARVWLLERRRHACAAGGGAWGVLFARTCCWARRGGLRVHVRRSEDDLMCTLPTRVQRTPALLARWVSCTSDGPPETKARHSSDDDLAVSAEATAGRRDEVQRRDGVGGRRYAFRDHGSSDVTTTMHDATTVAAIDHLYNAVHAAQMKCLLAKDAILFSRAGLEYDPPPTNRAICFSSSDPYEEAESPSAQYK
jgi:hypothetical protein